MWPIQSYVLVSTARILYINRENTSKYVSKCVYCCKIEILNYLYYGVNFVMIMMNRVYGEIHKPPLLLYMMQ